MNTAPDRLLFCEDCKSGFLYKLSSAGYYCSTKGCRHVQGITYIKLETIGELLGTQMATQIMTRIDAKAPIREQSMPPEWSHEVPPEVYR